MALTKLNKGFTLVELLVVIAIIALLSSIVIASLSAARSKGNAATTKSGLSQMRRTVDVYFNTNNYSYGVATPTVSFTTSPAYNASGANVFIADKATNSALAGIVGVGGEGAYAIGINGATYAVAAVIKGVSNVWWCVDSFGSSQAINNAATPILAGGTVAASCY